MGSAVLRGLGAGALAAGHGRCRTGRRLVGLRPARAPAVDAAVTKVVTEVAATRGFSEVRYDSAGTRTVPILHALAAAADQLPADASPLTADDVLLVTGGGKGITAECAIAIAKDSGAALAL